METSTPIFQPTALYQFSGTQLQQLIDGIVSKIVVQPSVTFAEMNTRQVRQHLSEKGYRVKSTAALPAVLSRYNISPTLKGKEYWYPTQEILKIPPKTSGK